jgi:serine/threonine protein phosphatase PrpC
MKLQVFANTTRGKEVNLDSFAYDLDLGVFLIADGVTGNVSKPMSMDIRRTGAIDACANTMEYLRNNLHKDKPVLFCLEEAITKANEDLLKKAKMNPSAASFNNALKLFNTKIIDYASTNLSQEQSTDIKRHIDEVKDKLWRDVERGYDYGTTLLALVIAPYGAYESHVGDSRMYTLKKDGSIECTADQMLGINKPVSLGTAPNLEIVKNSYELGDVDKFLLVTDGVSNALTKEDIRSILLNNNPQNAVSELLRRANYDPSEEAVKQFASKHSISAEEAKSILSGGDDCTAIVISVNRKSLEEVLEEKDREVRSLKELSGSQEQELDKYSENFDKLSESFEKRCNLLVRSQEENFQLTKSIADKERRLSSTLEREAELKKIIGDYAGLTETMKKNVASLDEIIKQKDAEISESRLQASLSDRRRLNIETKANEIIRYQKDFLGIIKTIEDNISKYDLQSGKEYTYAVEQFNSGKYIKAAELFGNTTLDSPDAGKAKAYLGIISLQKESEKLQSEQNHPASFELKLRMLAGIVKYDPENKTAINQRKEDAIEYAKAIGYYQKRKDFIDRFYAQIDRKLEGK